MTTPKFTRANAPMFAGADRKRKQGPSPSRSGGSDSLGGRSSRLVLVNSPERRD